VKKRAEGYVWCDSHCSIHERRRDPYEEGDSHCKPANWRSVYVETKDPEETF
jgi:hypothetical protein